MHHVLEIMLIVLALAGCSVTQRLTQPAGDGGWTEQRRREEIATRAQVSAAGAAAAVTVPNAQAGERVDLATVLELTRRNNPRIGEAQAGVHVAEARVRDSRGRLLPATIGSGRYTWYSDTLSNQLPPELLAAFGSSLPPGTQLPSGFRLRDKEAATLNGTVTLPIDLSGELWEALAAAQAGYRGERARLWATTLEQQVAAVQAYFQLLEAQRLREVTEQTVALDRDQLAHADALSRSGRATKNDVLVAQVALSNAEQRMLQRDLGIRRARWLLNQLTGREIDAPTEVEDVHGRPDLPVADDALRQAHEHNPVLVSLLEEEQRLDETARSLERSRFPRFNAGGAIDYTTSELLQPQDLGSGFVGFVWDLGTDTRREAQIAQARSTLDQTRSTLERQLREIETAVRSTHDAAAERLSALDAASVAVAQAEENLRIRQDQYSAGRAQSDDVLRAGTLLAQQRAILATAIYRAHARRAELQQLMGLPMEDLVSDWGRE